MIGNKIADKITSVSKKPAKELHNNDETKEEDAEIATPKKRYISPEERKQIIAELRLCTCLRDTSRKATYELRCISPEER